MDDDCPFPNIMVVAGLGDVWRPWDRTVDSRSRIASATNTLVRGAISIIVVGVRLPTAGTLGLSSGFPFISGVGVE